MSFRLQIARLILVVMALCLWAPVWASAQEAAASNYKIGVVDRKEVFDNYDKQKKEFSELEVEVKDLQKDIDALSEQIEADKAKYEKAKEDGSMGTEQLDELEQKIKSDFRKYQTEFKRLQAEIDSKHARLIKKLKREIDEAVAEVGAKENYHLILEGDPKSSSGVLYFSSTVDITPKVIELLNSKSE